MARVPQITWRAAIADWSRRLRLSLEMPRANRRVPSRHQHSMNAPSPSSDRQFSNADSFAQAFDEAWQQHNVREPNHGLSTAEKVPLILESLVDHPFAIEDPQMARQVADFRVRLLGL